MKKKDNINIKLFLVPIGLYISLIIGFFNGENLNFGTKPDWYGTNLPTIKLFAENFYETFLSYDNLNHRHSPVYVIFLSLLVKLGVSFEFIRFFHLNLCILLIYFFYKCLKLKFKSIDKNILILLSTVIFLSPTFRSIAIWPESRIIGLIFFTISIYEYLKFCEKKYYSHYFKNIIFLIISSYISPNFSVFILFFYYYYFKHLNIRFIIYGLIVCAISSIPAIYYLFFLDINFLLATTPGENAGELASLSFNFADKLMIISTIIIFHLFPFLFYKNFFDDLIKIGKKYLIAILFIFFVCVFFFSYKINFTGGGFFFQISNYLFENNFSFYLIVFLSLITLGLFAKENKSNILIFVLLVISNVQNTIYHKYYDPLIIIIFFTILNHNLPKNFLSKKFNLIKLYVFYLLYILMRLIKNTFFLI